MQHSKTESMSSTQTQSTQRLLLPRLLILAGAALLLLWSGLKLWHIGGAVRSLLAVQTQAETMMAGGLTQIDPDEAEALVMQVRGDVLTLKNETAFLMPLLPRLHWLPTVGPTLSITPQLVEMADAGTETAAYAVRGLKPALTILQDDTMTDRIPALVEVVHTAEPDLIRANEALDRVVAARAAIPETPDLPYRLQQLLQLSDEWLPLGQEYLTLALVLPEMAGINGQRRYLLMAQNEDELRPTGGFITGGGLLIVENGRIVDLTFQDANTLDNWAEKPYDFPPDVLYQTMGLELFLFRDANFWPDFPTSARQAMTLYSYGQDVPPLDGAIAIDQQFLKLLLQATGPVQIPEEDLTINSSNVIAQLQSAWAIQDEQEVRDWVQTRKSFLSTFAGALRQRIESDFATINPLQLARSIYTAVHSKHLQIYIEDQAVADTLASLNWDGHLEIPPDQDFLMVVDTNVGFNKVNLHIERSLAYHVTLADDGSAVANLHVTYTHNGPDDEEACLQDTYYAYGDAPDYITLANECYWNYMRVYAPAPAQLQSSSRHAVPQETLQFGHVDWDSEALTIEELPEATTFANFLMVPQAGTTVAQFEYTLPDIVQSADGETQQYTLTIAKQAGLSAQPTRLTITLPPTGELVTAVPQPSRIEGQTLHFNLLLDTDTLINIEYLP